MKRYLLIGVLALFLAGCSEPKSFETMSDVYYQPELPAAAKISVALPEEAAVSVIEHPTSGSIYLCDGYCVTMQTLPAGDLDATLLEVTGYEREKLTLMERTEGDNHRYECVWAAAGEGGDQIGRAVVLDDGAYHYALTVMADASEAGDMSQTWQKIIDSISLSTAP